MFGGFAFCYVFILLHHFAFANNLSICQYDTKKNLIVVALLNVYDEASGCTKVSLRGLQQSTLLEKIVADINRRDRVNEGMSLVLHVINTCSSQDNGITTALKSLVISQQTCANPPLLLGFIGPENYKQFQEVNKITTEFGKFHILPFAPSVRRSKEENSVMYVDAGRIQHRGEIIQVVMYQLQWRSIYAIVGENVALSGLLENLLNKVDRICVTGVSKIPTNSSTISNFLARSISEFQESGADGILLTVDDPSRLKPIINAMNEMSNTEKQNIPFIFYINQVGLKSWELPQDYRILMLQETSELSNEIDMKSLYNKTLWSDYIEQNGLDYQRDVLGDLLDSSIMPLEFGLNLLWNTAKYAKKIKCNLGNSVAADEGICPVMLTTHFKEWKTYLKKASYFEQISLRKISFEMNVPVTVKVYYHDIGFANPQLIGRITELGIMDLKMSLRSTIPTGAKTNPQRCISPPEKTDTIPIPTTINHDTNWLAVVSKKMKNLIQLEGFVSPQTNEKINTAVIWVTGIITFLFCLILITKCFYTIFRVETEEEIRQKERRKTKRTTRIMSE